MRSVIWCKSYTYLITWEDDHLWFDLVELNFGIDLWFKHWVAGLWISFTIFNLNSYLVTIHKASLWILRILVADIESSNWYFILDFNCLIISSSSSNIINMIETGNCTRNSLSLTKLEMNLQFIINHAFHHLSGNFEWSQRWWRSKILSLLSGFVKHFNQIWLSWSTFDSIIFSANLSSSWLITIMTSDFIDGFLF
jgi:hypothetical protein